MACKWQKFCMCQHIKILTTIQFRHTKILDIMVKKQLRNLCGTFLQESNERPPPELLCCLQESTNIRDLWNIDSAYIREVKERGMTTACHCFIQKIAFQQAKLGMNEWPCFPICIAYRSITWNYHTGKFTFFPFYISKTLTLMLQVRFINQVTFVFIIIIIFFKESDTHNMIHSDTINSKYIWQCPGLYLPHGKINASWREAYDNLIRWL